MMPFKPRLQFRIRLRDLFAEGAFSAAFVKVFTDYQILKSEEEAWKLASLVLNALVVILSVITLLGIIFSPLIVFDRRRISTRKSRSCDNFDADNVSVYFVCGDGSTGNGRFEYKRKFRCSRFGFDSF